MLIDELNSDVKKLVGQPVQSAIDVCHTVRDNIQSGSFWHGVEENGMSDLIVFQDGIENLRYIFLKVSDSETEKIIRINSEIDYYDNSAPENGGILTVLKCDLVDLGVEMQEASLVELVAKARLSSLAKQKMEVNAKIAEHEAEVSRLKGRLEEILADEERLNSLIKKEGTTDEKES